MLKVQRLAEADMTTREKSILSSALLTGAGAHRDAFDEPVAEPQKKKYKQRLTDRRAVRSEAGVKKSQYHRGCKAVLG